MNQKLYTQKFKVGDIIFAEGDVGDVAYIIEEGSIQISTQEHGNDVVLGTLGPGHLLGEMAMIDDAPRTATATARQKTVLTIISRDQLHERLDNADSVLRLLVNVIMARYRTGLSSVKGTPLAGHFYDPMAVDTSENENTALNKIRRENELKQALEQNELEVYYQPLLGIQQGKWAGFEALTRWNHPVEGPVSPLEFITLAEETTLIIPIGLYVLRRACEDMVKLQAIRNEQSPDSKPLFIGVNVSSKQLGEMSFIDEIARIVKETGMPAASLKLEITESMAADYQTVIKWVRHCKELGFTVAIDDFGTGYSSLEHLLELDVDTLKIDQAFIRYMKAGDKTEKLVEGIVRLSKSLDYGIVAEGIENQDQLDILSKLGCDLGQGYFIGKPQTLDEISQQLRDGA